MSSAIPSVDLRPDHWAIVANLLRRHVPDRKVVAFGSRATWTAKEYSDLDLAILGDEPLSADIALALAEGFGESDLPFKVDLVDWAKIDEFFRNIIRRDGVAVQIPGTRPVVAGRVRKSPKESQDLDPPGQWRSINLGRVCTKIGSGATPRGGRDVYVSDGPYALIRSQNVFNDGFHHDGLAYIDERHASELAGVEVQARDVLLNITGDSVARACMVDSRVLPARVNQHVAIIRPDPVKLDPGFLRYFLISPRTQVRLLSWAGAGGTRSALTKSMLETFDVSAPHELGEQRAIAHILGTLDDKIELNRRINATLEAMARALFKSWFVDFDPVRAKIEGRDTGLPKKIAELFPDRLVDSELGEIPVGWTVDTIGNHVVNFDSKRVPISGAARAKRKGPYPYHGAAGVLDHLDDYLFDGVFLLLGEDGSVMSEDGLAVTQYVWGKFWVNNHAHVLQGAGAVSTEQLYLHFSFAPVAPFVTGAVQPKLSQGRMNHVPFIFPGAAICHAFARVAQPWFARVRSCAEEARSLATLRDALLPKLVCGELRVNALESAFVRNDRANPITVHGA